MNNSVFLFFYNFANHYPVVDTLAVFIAKNFPILVIFGAFVFLLFHHEVMSSENPLKRFTERWKEIMMVFVVSISAWIIARILKIIINIDRPFLALPDIHPLINDDSFSFPSGHATFFAALATAIFFYHRKAGYVFMLCALLIGLARMVVGVHYPIDILGGFVLGVGIAYFFKRI